MAFTRQELQDIARDIRLRPTAYGVPTFGGSSQVGDRSPVQGSLLKGNGSGQWIVLALGADGQVLTVSGEDASWQDIPAPPVTYPRVVATYSATGQVTPGNDLAGHVFLASAPAGYYRITASLVWTVVDSTASMRVYANGTQMLMTQRTLNEGYPQAPSIYSSSPEYCAHAFLHASGDITFTTECNDSGADTYDITVVLERLA